MKKHLRLLNVFAGLLAITLGTMFRTEIRATGNLEVITAHNLDRLQQLRMLRRGTIEEMSWSPDGQLLAVGGSAGGWIYRSVDLQAEPMHFAQFMQLDDLAFSPNGALIVSTGQPDAIYLWDAKTGELVREIRPPSYNPNPYVLIDAISVEFSPDGSLIAVCAANGAFLLIEAQTGDVFVSVPRTALEITFSPDGSLIATTEYHSGTVTIWETHDLMEMLSTVSPQTEIHFPFTVWNIDFSPDGSMLYGAGFVETQLFAYSFATQRIIPLGPGTSVIDVSIDGTLATEQSKFRDAMWFTTIDLIDPSSGGVVAELEGDIFYLTDIRFSPDGSLLVAGSADGTIQMWDVDNRQLIDQVEPGGSAIADLALLDDDTIVTLDGISYDVATLADGGYGGGSVLRLWNIATGEEEASYDAADLGYDAFDFLAVPPGQRLVLLHPYNSTDIVVFDPDSGNHFTFPADISLAGLQFDSSGNYMVTASNGPIDDTIIVWNITGGINSELQPLWQTTHTTDEANIQDVVISLDGRYLLASTFQEDVFVFNTQTGDHVTDIEWSPGRFSSTPYLSFSHDGATLTINDGHAIHLVDAATWAEYAVLLNDQEGGTGSSAYFGPNDDFIITLYTFGFGAQMAFWNVEDGTKHLLPAQASNPNFTSDGTMLITGGFDGTIRFWGVPSDE